MKRFFPYLMLITGLFAVSCGSGYQVASSRYDDATYFRPDVTARVHMLANAQEAEALINQTIIKTEREGGKVETVYTDPQGVANIDVEPGTTYLVMNSQDDSYERKLEMFSDEPDDSFSLTINMSFDYSNWWNNPFFDYPWYGAWNRYRYGYMPMSYWDYWYWYPRTWYRDFWYYDWSYNYWYYPSWYNMWSYSGIWGMYPYGHHYYHNNTDRRDNRSEYRNDRRQDLGRSAPGSVSASSIRSGGSYTRTNPKIEQVSGNRAQRTRDIVDNKVDNKNEITSESGTTNYRRVTGTTGSSAVYRDPASTARARTEGARSENTFYRRSSNLSQENRENTRSESSGTTTNPGNSRNFYRGTQRPSATVNSENAGSSRSVRSSSGSTSGSRSTGSYNSGSSSTNRSSSSSSSSRSSSMGSSVSSGSSRSSSSGSTGGGGGASRSGSGGSYRR